MTDFENAACCVFLVLVKAVIVKYKLNMYVPIQAVQDDMQRAHARDAVTGERFAFRRDPFGEGDGEEDLAKLSVNEIVNGSERYVGMMPLIERYMKEAGWTEKEKMDVGRYLDLVRCRASGEHWTTAKWMREFVLGHAEYKQDSRVSGKICYDMMREVKNMMEGGRKGRMFEKE